LGVGDNSHKNTPQELPGKVKDITAGRYHTLMVGRDEKLYSFGDNRV
jgi:alpha-tubulin suppressor-like RCC1 family protein